MKPAEWTAIPIRLKMKELRWKAAYRTRFGLENYLEVTKELIRQLEELRWRRAA